MVDSNGNKRFCFEVPANFMICLNCKTEVEAWHKLRSWLDEHKMSLVGSIEGDNNIQRTPLHNRSQLKAVLESSPEENKEKEVFLQIDCHEIWIVGRSI